ncbi:MAG TPA: hypothetical protein VHD95_09075 [Rhizomicrobium sp.]|jgi:hypothetical protein|nr:hypothetical protein [Rhizomicrobium sp.]
MSKIKGKAMRDGSQTKVMHGKRAIAVKAAKEYDGLKKSEKPHASFKEHLLRMPKDNGTFERIKVRFRDFDF